MAGLQTEYGFTLPKGYVDRDGTLYRHGTMRLATARDEIEPLRDQRISGPDDPYLTVLVIARVLTELGTVRQVTPREVEDLFAADLAFLQDLYGIINFGDPADVAVLQEAVLGAERADEVAQDVVIEPDEVTGPAAVRHDPNQDVIAPTADESDFSISSGPRRAGRIEEVKANSER